MDHGKVRKRSVQILSTSLSNDFFSSSSYVTEYCASFFGGMFDAFSIPVKYSMNQRYTVQNTKKGLSYILTVRVKKWRSHATLVL